MSKQLNFKQVPFDTMYYNNLTKQGGQVLIECDPNRTVLKIIESCITKNNTVLSNAELAQWILRYYISRTKNHVSMVQVCASYLKEFFSFGGYFERFMAKVQQHDYDKFSGNEHVASYAMNAPLYKYPNLYDISPEAKRIYEEIEWPKHHQLHDHHPEHYMRCVDEENDAWTITDDEMEEFFKDKGGHPAALIALGEMVADWIAVGVEMGNTAKSWWLKNKDTHWSYGPRYTQALEACLAFAPEQLFIDQIDPIPEPPEQRTTQVSTESYAMEGWFDPVKEEGMHYTIRNFPVISFFNKLRKEYKTSKLEHLFDVIGIRLFSANKRTIVIHKFFVPELLYLLDKYNFPNSLITTIRSNTWVGAVRPITGSVDLNYINQTMQVSLYDHQTEFLKNYLPNKIKNHLRGYLLSFEQGLGKTITSICLMEGLKKERIVIICPKNTMMETWNAHLIKFFKDTQKVWVAGYTKGPLYTSARWIIVNYERIDEVKEFLIKNPMNNLGIIVDESHNFLRTSSQRTQQLIDLANNNRNADILMMSGTPIKCVGNELLPIMRVLDPYCDDEAVAIFKRTFGFNTSIANDVLSARLSRMMTRVRKDILNLPEKKESVVNVKMSTGWKYTASQVEKQIVEFVRERQDYYNQHLQQYIEAFEEAITWLKRDPVVGRQPDFQRYLNIIDWLRESHISDARGNADIVWANQYEKDVLIPALPEDLRKKFIWSKSVVKYLPLKIKGEVIGTLLTRLRMQMTTEMLQAADIKQYVDNAVKKTVVFTSYVDTIEVAYNYFKSQGYNVAAVYGKTASELTDTIQQFQEDQSVNPLIASLKMLSTGATLTAANTVIFLNKPWRSIEYQQASDRVHRIGQDTECEIISLVLDTGKEPNLSTRMEDIMQWSSDQFDQIVDQKEREMMRKFFKSFASLEIPEDCVMSLEKADTKTKIKEITFPSEEIDTLKKQNRIVTTRVSADYNKFFVDDFVRTPWGDIFKVTKREEISDVKDHPYFNELTEGQKKFLSKYSKIAVLTLMKTKVQDALSFSTESMALLTSTPEERRLTNLAKPLYVPIGKNSWEHIQQDVGNAIDIIRTLQGRGLTLKEYAAILFHDCSVKARKSKDRHSYYSAEMARQILSKTTYFTSEDIDEICQAIEEHDEFINPNGIHSSDLSDLLASADCNPPNVAWILNKSYSHGMENGLTHEERIQNAVRYIPKKYGTHGTIVYPKMYAAFNKKAIIKMQQTFDTLTPEECERIIMDYRRRHGLKEGDLSLPDPSLESISSMAVESLDSKSSDPGLKLYHLSYGQPVASKTLTPRIPDNEFVEWGVEDGKTKRICFATSISKATLALGRCKEGQEFHVYEVDLSSVDQATLMKHIVTPSKDQVPDVDITKEVWCTIPVKVKYTKTIKLTSIKHEYTLKFKRKDGTEYVGHPREWNYDVVSTVDPRSESQPSTEQLGSSMEASTTPSKIAQKKKKILDFICKLCDTMEPSGLNSKRYRQIIGQMNDKEFDQFMNYMKEGKWQLHIVAPNMIVNLQNEDLLKACDLIGLDLFQRVWMYDKATGRKFLTDNKYMFVKLPIRRQQQFLDEKISVPDNDRTIDGLTGQVTGDSRSCSITNPEIQILAARGLNNTLQELVNIRGGNIHGYSEFRRMLEENGEGDLDMLDTGSRTRASVVGGKLLQSMMLDTNL